MIAEPLQEWRTVCVAFFATSFVRQKQGRIEEATAVRERCYRWRSSTTSRSRRCARTTTSRGDRNWEDALTLLVTTARVARGEWDAMPALGDDGLPVAATLIRRAYLPVLARVQAARADTAGMHRTLRLTDNEEASTNQEFGSGPNVARAIALGGLGRNAEALELALPIATGSSDSVANEDRREAYVEVGLAALAVGDEGALERLVAFVAELPPAMRTPLLRAGAARFAGLLAWRRGDARAADERLAAATRELREIESPFNLAQVLLEHAEVLTGSDREDEAQPLLGEARTIFAQLGAVPWLQRCEALATKVAA